MPEAAVLKAVNFWLGSGVHELVFQIYHQKNAGTISFLSLLLLFFLNYKIYFTFGFVYKAILLCVCSHARGYP